MEHHSNEIHGVKWIEDASILCFSIAGDWGVSTSVW